MTTTKTLVEQALREVEHMTSQEFVEHLTQELGYQNTIDGDTCDSCPVARWLTDRTGRPIRVGAWTASFDSRWYIDLPKPVIQALKIFDHTRGTQS